MWEAPIRTLRTLTAAILLFGILSPAYGQTAKPPPAAGTVRGAPSAPINPINPITPGATSAPGAAPDGAAPTPAPVIVDEAFVLGVGDAVDIGVLGRTDFNNRARITTEGTILLPLLGKVKALGLTTAQLAQQIQDALSKGGFYSNPVVRVEVSGVASRYATVLGNVATPGLMPLDRTYHLSDVIARVGAHTGEGSSYVVLTRADGSSKKYSMEDLATGGGGADPLVMAGDKIYVPAATSEVFYISGQVRNPGPFPVSKELTVREAIARGGGLTEMGSEKKVKIYRKNVAVKDVKLDTKIEAGDIVEVGERLF
jgi:polysaccharide export outer membrane protein